MAARSTLAALIIGAALVTPNQALAYCRSTTCVPADMDCATDRSGCVIDGTPLRWGSGCVTFAVEAAGSPRRGISYEAAHDAAREAFREWVAASCSSRGEHPTLAAVDLGSVECDHPEYNDDPPLPNANSIVFRDEEWPYGDDTTALALTTITFDSSNGELLDADIEVNSASVFLSVGDIDVRTDLQAILTHEVGHLLGLAHSAESDATMSSGYDGTDLGFRDLAQDDEQAICEAYRPGDDLNRCHGVQPRYGFSRVCGAPYENSGCQFAVPRATSGWFGFVAIGLLGWCLRRRRHHRQPSLAE